MKKLLTILVLIMLIISFFQITSMYALYKEELQSEYSTLLGVWAIKVNETDVVTADGQTSTFTITDENVGYVGSTHVLENKIAPGEQAYFDIEIDPTNTDVSIIYEIDVGENLTGSDNTAGINIELVNIINYFQQEVAEGETAEQVTNEEYYKNGNLYTGIIPMDVIRDGYKNYIRLYFEWVNVEANNETDSDLAEVEGSTIAIPVSINLKQYTGEVISNGS